MKYGSDGDVLLATEREALLREWFGMWLAGEDRGITRIFAADALLAAANLIVLHRIMARAGR